VLMQFGERYAKVYDIIYANKDYKKEVSFLDEVIQRYAWKVNGKPIEVIDIGCGTGRHAELLQARGYKVFGVEPSPYMAEIARERGIDVHVGRVYEIDEIFDVGIAMFNVMGYIGADRFELLKTLEWAYDHCLGAFVFDFWNAKVVLTEGLKPTARDVGGIRRMAAPKKINPDNTVEICITVRKGKDEFSETHKIRFYFIDEIYMLLKAVGFSEIQFYKPWGFEEADDNDFLVVCVAVG